MTDLVHLDDLVIRYARDRRPAVNGLSLSVHSGEVLGLLGGNGAGKSSTLRAIAGIQPANDGTIRVAGFDLGRARDVEAARRRVGYCPDTGGLLRTATVREHIGLALALHRQLPEWPAALELVQRFDLQEVLDQPTSGFSHGMSRRLSVLLAVLTAQDVLILDEPFDGVDPLGVAATEAVIREAAARGLAVLVSTHLHSLLVGVADRVAVMVDGSIVATGPAAEFAGTAGESRYATLLRERRS